MNQHTPARRAALRAALAAEYATASLKQIAARRGVSWQAIQRQLHRHNIPRRPRGGDPRTLSTPHPQESTQ